MKYTINDFRGQVEDIIKFSALTYSRSLVSASGGNVSERLGDIVLITGSNVSLREVRPEDIVICNLDGKVLFAREGLHPSKETRFHTGIYKLRPDVKGVIHAHPNFSTIWSMEDEPLPMHTKSAQMKLRMVPVVPDGYPGTDELANAVAATVHSAPNDTCAFLLRNHGSITVGTTLEDSFNAVELLEDTAKIAVFYKLLAHNPK